MELMRIANVSQAPLPDSVLNPSLASVTVFTTTFGVDAVIMGAVL